MFGRRLKKEYRLMEYCIVDKNSGEVAEVRNMPLSDPVMTVVSSGFVFSLFIGSIIGVITRSFTDILLSDSNVILLFGILFVIGACISYYFMTDSTIGD